MPRGLVRTDLNTTGVSYRNGNPVPPASPSDNSNPVNWVPSPAHFGNPVTVTPTGGREPQPAPIGTGNVVNWAPSPAHFGNKILPGVDEGYGIELEDGLGLIELEDGDTLLLEQQ